MENEYTSRASWTSCCRNVLSSITHNHSSSNTHSIHNTDTTKPTLSSKSSFIMIFSVKNTLFLLPLVALALAAPTSGNLGARDVQGPEIDAAMAEQIVDAISGLHARGDVARSDVVGFVNEALHRRDVLVARAGGLKKKPGMDNLRPPTPPGRPAAPGPNSGPNQPPAPPAPGAPPVAANQPPKYDNQPRPGTPPSNNPNPGNQSRWSPDSGKDGKSKWDKVKDHFKIGGGKKN
ncbi:hypothetical protein GGTG_11133 [Gaeumannomyces tritici R3-111a-1]|uniref:Uncharacterized protein n=1 Tax=Gaeumannomyces tritici (strain R3-111a-1) TaxID=644352 RepID=J3PCB0_GAET3|nr:hypothetical protein GGTG_11133 [Gaeumannomyces tritici R3-111a-1]EJT71880.1 hypothetical protein GGTG_11133 [Gaeumannomyces tritici R3-111a-1]